MRHILAKIHLLAVVRRWLRLTPTSAAKPRVRRDSRWPKVRTVYLTAHSTCAACGIREHLEVHHIEPFHLFPALELDPANLLTLCESPSHNCHCLFGHGLNWKLTNQNVIKDAAACLAMLRRVHSENPDASITAL